VQHEVLVAGAGPGGVAAAVAAVRADPSLAGRVLVIDRARFPRAKPCGGGLTGHVGPAMERLGLALTVPSFPSPRATVRYGSFVREVALPLPVRVIRREEFDASLVEQARDLGVEVREGVALTGFTVEEGGVRAGTSAGPLRASVLVGADGAGSLVRKHLDGRAHLDDRARLDESRRSDGDREARRVRGTPIRLFRAELADGGRARDDMLYDFTPMRDGLRGYLWIFPVPGGRLNVGLMHSPTVPRSGGELATLLGRRLAEHGVALDGATPRGWPAWGYLPARAIAAPHLLTVGDAAGIDALTGEGIAVALEHGLVAGGAIAEARASGDFSFTGYRRALRRADVGRDLALDRWLAKLLYGGDHRRWLGLVLHDHEVLELYAARVSGSVVLADRKRALAAALVRHVVHGRARRRALRDAEA
jgi:flavin-dependent dehydrogenase